MIKPDEMALMRRALAGPIRGDGDASPITNREFYVLMKWADRGWWEYGLHARFGWLTDEGRVAVAAIVEAAAQGDTP